MDGMFVWWFAFFESTIIIWNAFNVQWEKWTSDWKIPDPRYTCQRHNIFLSKTTILRAGFGKTKKIPVSVTVGPVFDLSRSRVVLGKPEIHSDLVGDGYGSDSDHQKWYPCTSLMHTHRLVFLLPMVNRHIYSPHLVRHWTFYYQPVTTQFSLVCFFIITKRHICH